MSIETINESLAAVDGDYTGGNVKVLRDADHIRQRPDMYIGDRGTLGLHHLIYELVANSTDEALAGHCKLIQVIIHADGSASVIDDGRGIPVDPHPDTGRPTLEVVLTIVGAGAKFDHGVYKVSSGLHGMGAKAVTALSEWSEAEVKRDGKIYLQKYARGKPTSDVEVMGTTKTTGTRITFMPDSEIFENREFKWDVLETRYRELAYLNRGLRVKLLDERSGKSEEFCFQGGIAEYVQYLNRNDEVEHSPPIYIRKEVDKVQVEVAFQYYKGEVERVRCYTNNAYNPNGGAHQSGFRAAMSRALGGYGEKMGMFTSDNRPIGEDYREGLTAIISVQVPDPHFEAQTKLKLNNPEVEGCVSSAVYEILTKYLEENPREAKSILNKVITSAKAREAARKARDAAVARRGLLSGGGLPGKLMDCTSKSRDESELFLVEGDSAGGSAESGRERKFQAVLPLRGKPLNVEKAKAENVLKNEEIASIISALGVDIGNSDDLSRLRYGKIIILTDADVDGQHIRTLLLTFFFRQMRKLVENGHIWVARPPLFKVSQKGETRFVQTVEQIDYEMLTRGLRNTRLRIVREPALVIEGEQLSRLVVQNGNKPMGLLLEIERSLQILERRGVNLSAFLSRGIEGTLPAYHTRVGRVEHWFRTPAEVQSHMAGISDAETKEYHEVHTLNRDLEQLRAFGLGPADFVPAVRVAGREPPVRFMLESGESSRSLSSLRELIPEIRKLGEKGMAVTRFKGLGEMNPDELWKTTLDPQVRTILQVTMDDAVKADEMFRILMGDKVEPRKKFIDDHALHVADIDYHSA